MSPSDFMHPEDAAALRQLESIPGFPSFIKSVLSLGLETLQFGINTASAVRLSERQLPDLYRHLPPICQKLGISVPEFYLSMDPVPNAWTFGDTRIFMMFTCTQRFHCSIILDRFQEKLAFFKHFPLIDKKNSLIYAI